MKLIALDLDGTLLNSGKVVSQRNFAALSLAAEQGHVIVPATGRALRAFPPGHCWRVRRLWMTDAIRTRCWK